MDVRRALAALALALLTALAPAGSAAGQSTGNFTPPNGPVDPNGISRAQRPDVRPKDHRLTADQAKAVGLRDARFRRAVREERSDRQEIFLKGQTRWQLSAYAGSSEVAQVIIDDRTAMITESWTGPQVAWLMARGYPGAFGRKVNAPWVWISLAALFLLALVDRARWRSWLLVDGLVLTAFGASYAIFNTARIDISVPLVYPLLVYIFVRAVLIGLGRARAPGPPLRPLLPAAVLVVGLLFLVGFRIGLNVVESNVIDVGYAGVIGADRMVGGEPIWGGFPKDNPRGDTYGPVVYAAYVPFEALFPWKGRWDQLDAAHGVAIAFDLLCMALLLLIGRRLRDRRTGVLLAFLWAACPFTLLVMNTNGNDAIVGALVLAGLLGATSAPARGAFVALAGWSKFAPLGLAPLFLLHGERRDRLPFLLAFAGVTVVCAALVLFLGNASLFVDRTIGFQAERGSPFSVWGAWELPVGQRIVQALGVLFALLIAVVPRRRDTVGLAACTVAVLVALQLGVTHWFYLYLGWWLGPLLVALIAVPAPAARPTAPAAARWTPPVAEPARSG